MRLNRRQRRELGLTVQSAREARRKLVESGELIDTDSPQMQRLAILTQIQEDNADAWESFQAGKPKDFDWDAFLAFIERLIALLAPFLN